MNTLSESLYTLFSTSLSPDEAGTALGITFGIKEHVPKLISEQMKIIGASHILVLSGANISLLMNLITSSISFLPKKLRELCAIATVLIFVSVIPIQSSVIRATIMSVTPRIGVLFNKRSHSLYLLFLSCLAIIAINTKVLTEISFQLSFLAVLGITLFNKLTENIDNSQLTKRFSLSQYINSQLYTCLSAQTFTAPLIFYYFGTISLISPLSNIILAPFITPIMSLSIVYALIGSIFPSLNMAVSYPLHILLFIFLHVVQYLSGLSFTYISY